MKKKVFREMYNMVNGDGNVVKQNLTVEEVKEIVKEAALNEKFENAVAVKVEVKKRGRRRSVK